MGKTRKSANLVAQDNITSDIDNNRVGICNTTPGYALDVTGDFNVSGTIYQAGSEFSGGGGDVVSDTTPQLGGNLDINGKYITGTGGANITGVVTATSVSVAGHITLNNTGANIIGVCTATSFVKSGGTSSEYLMADGSTSTGGGGGGGVTTGKAIAMAIVFG